MPRKDTKKQSAGDAIEDVRKAMDALIEVNNNLQTASTACRALVHDTRLMKDPALSKSARRLLSIVNAMKSGPNIALWEPLQALESGAQAAYSASDQK